MTTLGKISVNNLNIIEVDQDPRISIDKNYRIGCLALLNNGKGTTFVKYGTLSNQWTLSGSVFGSEFTYATDPVISATSSTAFVPKLTLNFNNPFGGTYLFSVSYHWGASRTNHSFKAQVLQNGTNIYTHFQEPKDRGADEDYVTSDFIFLDIASGVDQTFELQYGADVNFITSYIGETKMSIWRVQ